TIGFSIPISNVIEQLHEWSNEAVTEDLEIGKVSDRVDQLNEEQLQNDALYVIDYFFEGIKMRDFIGSYTLLGSDMQAAQSYVNFRDSYIHSTSLTYDEPVQTMLEDHQVEMSVHVTITSKEKNEDKRIEHTIP